MSDKKILSVDEMLAVEDVTYAEVEAWGGIVRLRSLDAGSMIDFVEANKAASKSGSIRLLIQSLVDADGNPIGRMDMLGAFQKKNAATITSLTNAIFKLNGLGRAGVDISQPLRAAGTDAGKLQKLVADLRGLADSIEAAGTDEVKLAAVLEPPVREVVKND